MGADDGLAFAATDLERAPSIRRACAQEGYAFGGAVRGLGQAGDDRLVGTNPARVLFRNGERWFHARDQRGMAQISRNGWQTLGMQDPYSLRVGRRARS